jgi:hypothetical protein
VLQDLQHSESAFGSWFGLTNYLITFSANPLFEEEFQRGQALAKRMGAVLASYDVAMSDTRCAFRGETDQVRIALNALLDALFFCEGNSQR